MGRMFGTDGVRGVANTELTAQIAYNLGRAGAYVLTEGAHKPKILVAKDTRISGDMLVSALIAGILSVGAEAVVLGVVPTPAVAYLTRKYGADAGVMISASHNPVEYNGIKFFNDKGYKLSDELEDEIQRVIESDFEGVPSPTGTDIGKETIEVSALDDYIEFAKETIPYSLKGLKIALVKKGCDLGFAFDGDADRCLAVDEKGNLVNGDFILMLCAKYLKEIGKLKDDTLVVTVMSNLGLDIAAKKEGVNIVKTSVGDRYVLEEMIKDNYVLGGEQSGHVIFLDYNTTGDGLVTALQIASIVKKKEEKLSELCSIMKELPQVLANATIPNEKKNLYLTDEEIQSEIKKIEDALNGVGRVLIRPSGTEPLVRVMLEGENQAEIDKIAHGLADLIEKKYS